MLRSFVAPFLTPNPRLNLILMLVLAIAVMPGTAWAQRIYDATGTIGNLVKDSGFGQCKGLVKNHFKRVKLNNVYVTTHTSPRTQDDTLQLSTVWGQENQQVMTEITLRKIGRACSALIEMMFSVSENCSSAIKREPEYSELNNHLGVIYAQAGNGSRKYLYPTGDNGCMIVYRHNSES